MVDGVVNQKRKSCIMCGGATGGKSRVVLERTSQISRMRWAYPVCEKCMMKMKEEYDNSSGDTGM